jgi:hypothetical protein
MKKMALALLTLLVMFSCVPPQYQSTLNTANEARKYLPPVREVIREEPDDQQPMCSRLNTLPVKKRQLYEDYYGTMLTTDKSWLRTPGGNYNWGIANAKRLSMAYFAAYVKATGKYARFKTSIYIDSGIKADMVFTIRANSRDGEVLKNLTIRPGQTRKVDIETGGAKKLFIFTELRINHDAAEKIVLGEPEFYNCR